MVTVAHQHVLQVLLPPRIEILRIIAGLPLVERLVNNDKPHAVAKVEELRRRLVVAAPDGIYPILLANLQFAFHGTQGQSRTQRGIVLVQTETFQLQGLPVEQETAVGSELARTHAEYRFVGIDQFAPVIYCGMQSIKIRMFRVPQLRTGDFERMLCVSRLPGSHLQGLLAGLHYCAPLSVRNLLADGQSLGTLRLVRHRRADTNLRPFRRHHRSRDVSPVGGHMHLGCFHQPGMTVNSRTGVPTCHAVVFQRIVYPDSQHVFGSII